MESAPDRQTEEMVKQYFERLRGPEGDKFRVLADLFADLNYGIVQDPLPTFESQAAQEAIAEDAPAEPMILAEAGGGSPTLFESKARGDFKVIYCPLKPGERESARLLLTRERAVAQQVLREEHYPDCLMVFSDPDQTHWHFVNPRLVTRTDQAEESRRARHVLRRISVGPEDKLRTAIDRFSIVALSDQEADTLTAQAIHERHNKAFDVEAVTDLFFGQFKETFLDLQGDLLQQVDNLQWAHDYALRLMSRIMFVYFVQRKRWLGHDPDFMANYWQAYVDSRDSRGDRFHDEWLEPLFFEAFASPQERRRIESREYVPENLRQALHNAPYLNGGLFARDKLDRSHRGEFRVPDEAFARLLGRPDGFFESYNFTISEDSPLDQEVAVDPEMIGRVYESLVNISEPGSEAADDREKQREAGIFYTPRTEIDLMCRLALSDYLRNHLGTEHRDLIYQLMFSLDPDEKDDANAAAAAEDLWPETDKLLTEVTVVDPACGSGSFLVGMMNILTDLRRRADRYSDDNPTDYELKRDIIRTSLYGVDVMPWAVEIAELRLWLQLMVHTELDEAELRGVRPLLPNLTFKIRQGDSLVQEIGGVNLAHLKADTDIPSQVSAELRRLRSQKLSFFDAHHPTTEDDEQRLHNQERNLFLRIYGAKTRALEGRTEQISTQLNETRETLDGGREHVRSAQERQRLEAEHEEVENQLRRLTEARVALGEAEQTPFVWDLAFVETFEGDRKGFDIVVGNPPYVRQEKIADPQAQVPYDEQSVDDRKEYKAKLNRSVYAAYPKYFGPDPDKPRVKLSGRSDLYIHFYFHALSLLNEQGAFCFVTSNSWLDVGYGAELQEFLARQAPIHMVIDNQVKRSFSTSDVNTIIVLFGAPQKETDAAVEQTARFVMAQVPFEQILHPVVMMEIDDASERTQKHEFRVFPMTQRDLLEAGSGLGEEREGTGAAGSGPLIKLGKYEGDKWGGKYLRAPDIYWEILEKAGDKLVPLGEIAEVRFGIKTGCNEFFYLPSEHFDIELADGHYHLWPMSDDLPGGIRIEERFLEPAVYSLKEIRCIEDDLEGCKHLLLKCHDTREELAGLRVLEYIRWGEAQGFHERSTCASRSPWYSVAEGWHPAPLVFPAKVGERMVVLRNANGYWEDKKLYGVTPRVGSAVYWASVLNSTLCRFFMDLSCRQLTGAQAIADVDVNVVEELPIPRPALVDDEDLNEPYSAIAKRPIEERVSAECAWPDRRALDRVFFEVLGLTNDQREMVYDSVISLVEDRLAKAAST